MAEEYEQALRRAVRLLLEGDDDVTVNSARERAEKELGLDAGFFKHDARWKGKSKDIIQTAVDDPQSSPEKPEVKPAVVKAKNGTKRKSNDVPLASNKRGKKAAKTIPDSDASEASGSEVEGTRKQVKDEDEDKSSEFGGSDEDEKPETTAKKATSKGAFKPQAKPAAKRKSVSKKVKDESGSGSESEAEAKSAPKPAKRKPATSKKSQDAVQSDSEGEDIPAIKCTRDESKLSEAHDNDDEPPKANGKPPAPEDDESDMSVLIDDPPPKKKRECKGTSKAKPTKASKPAASKKKGPDLAPDEEKIKRLQSWLVKCGMRKVWHKELEGCDTDKAKIKHLKKMLEGVGMTGRYSNEKASSIKEARELADEIAAAQEYDARWGMKAEKDDHSDDDEDGSGGEKEGTKAAAAVPRRPKGFVDFGDSGDDTD